ncbi:hypothetical protein RHGRI_034720 [Rhododendron griersonianum]|uniref:Minichromosome loss protein Mcl1 middle region domain-containing protein n=1 Tax=Rhododendron griersonianum TaxID=479676 RepID=A0AAV6I1R9_9ERIC|nr:hypothetical protein RHGRI_034720 [Rhododendron griersonianum]
MKIRSIKLREAHKNGNGNGNGAGSFCSILWDLQAQHIVTSSSSDPSICIHDPLLLSSAPRILRNHRDGVTSLALSPNSTCLASGSVDHSVKLYKFPGGEFQTNITRFTLPIRVLGFNKSGSMLAAAGDDEGIKLINTIDGSIARVLKGHRGSVTGLGFDPKSEYLASLDSAGTVIVWELQSGRALHTLKGIAPDTGLDFSLMNIVCWSPDGEMLAVPGLKNDVVMYDRDTAEKLFSLRGDHVQRICFLSWSPNGKYMATSGLDRQVLIWDVDQRLDIDRQKFDDVICCMAWKPTGNALAVIDAMGKYGIWDSAVPSSMKSPTEGIPDLQSKNSNGLLFFDEEEEEEPNISGSLSDLGEDSHGESQPPSRKRLRKQSFSDVDEGTSDELSLLPKDASRKRPSHNHKEGIKKRKDVQMSTTTSVGSKLQEAFQPGCTPTQPGKRRFLCYNMLGSITTIEHDGYSHIEIDFHDTGRGPRVPAMTDYFGFTMAALNENGSVFANPCKGEKSMSTLMYRPFSSWANNSEWSMRFEDEEVKVVALGTAWVAAVTSLNFLRIFTEGGLQRNVLSLDGPVVTAVGFGDELAVVTHASPSLPSNDQMLEFRVFNIRHGTQPIRGRLPVTPGSYLTWFGFSEEGKICTFDSKGVLRVFTDQYGGSWLPLFSSTKVRKPEENHWVVGLNAIKLFCVVCKSPDTFPQVIPKPVLNLMDLSFPLASSDLGADNLENEFILHNLHLSQINKTIEEMMSTGQDTTSLDDEAFNMDASLDRCIFKLIASCCNGDKLVRATELVKLLSFEKSVKGAIELAKSLKLPNLAERFTTIQEERLLSESKAATAFPVTNLGSDTSDKSDFAIRKSIPPLESSYDSKPAIPSPSQKLPSPPFMKKVLSEAVAKAGKAKVKQGQAANLENIGEVKNDVQLKNAGEVKNVEVKKTGEENKLQTRPSNSFAKSSDVQLKNAGEVKNAEVKKTGEAKNPFAKSSNKQEKSSLFDSLKKKNVK